MKTSTTHCRLVIIDEVCGEPTFDTVLPEGPDEVLRCCLIAHQAAEYCECRGLFHPDDALAVSIRKGPVSLTIRWHAVGDIEEARRRLVEVREGRAMA